MDRGRLTMTEENDSLHDDQRWNHLWNNPDLTKRRAFRVWNTDPTSLTEQQRLLVTELFKEVSK